MKKIILILITGVILAACSSDKKATQDENQNQEANSTEMIMEESDTISVDATVEEIENTVDEVSREVEEISNEIDNLVEEI